MSPAIITRGALYRRLQSATDAAAAAAARVRELRAQPDRFTAARTAERIEWLWIELACLHESRALRTKLGIAPCAI